MLFYKTYFEESNVNLKPIIWSKYYIITKFGQKLWASLVIGKVYKPENRENEFFLEAYFKESNINCKPHIWSKYKIITKFEQK